MSELKLNPYFGQYGGMFVPQLLVPALKQLEQAGADAALVMKSVREVMVQVESGQGTAGMILSDSAFKAQMQRTMVNVESSTYNFNQNMEALKSNFLFRKYFKKQEKEK